MKIAVIADAHANLPALKAALNAIHADGCDSIFHVGDAIAIGPYPAECVDLLHSSQNIKCVAGNHELYFLNGIPSPQPGWMSEGEVKHQLWTHEQLGDGRRSMIEHWPLKHEDEFDGVKTIFVHYGLTSSGDDFVPIVRDPGPSDMDKIFREHTADILFFGHHHPQADITGTARYINPGSLGCNSNALARYTLAEYKAGRVNIQHRSVHYEDTELLKTFEERNVPERGFIYKAFFGGRFGDQAKRQQLKDKR